MKKKLEEFLELEKKAKKFNPYTHENYLEHIELYSKALTIAPQAVRKLLEAAELLERAKEEIQNIYGRDNDLTLEIFKFLEDFENEN